RVAVGRRARDGLGRDVAGAARAILDHERLVEDLFQLLADDAGEHVARPAGRESDDERDRAGGVVGGVGRGEGERKEGGGGGGAWRGEAGGGGGGGMVGSFWDPSLGRRTIPPRFGGAAAPLGGAVAPSPPFGGESGRGGSRLLRARGFPLPTLPRTRGRGG